MLNPCFFPISQKPRLAQRLHRFFRRSSHSRSCSLSAMRHLRFHHHRPRGIAGVAFLRSQPPQEALHPSGTGPHEAVDAPSARRLRLAGAAVVVACVGHIVCFGCSSGRGRHATTTPQGGAFRLATRRVSPCHRPWPHHAQSCSRARSLRPTPYRSRRSGIWTCFPWTSRGSTAEC